MQIEERLVSLFSSPRHNKFKQMALRSSEFVKIIIKLCGLMLLNLHCRRLPEGQVRRSHRGSGEQTWAFADQRLEIQHANCK